MSQQRQRSPWAGIDSAVARHDIRTTPSGDIATARALFPKLPDIYADWAARYGALTSADGNRRLLGVVAPGAPPDLDAVHAARVLRALYKLPTYLLPIEMLPDRQVACVAANNDRAPVFLLDLDNMKEGTVKVAPSLEEFVYEWRADLAAIKTTLSHLDKKKRAIASGRRAADQLDRPGDWSLTRMCSEDVIIAVLRSRHSRQHNRQDVSVFAIAALTAHAPGAPVRAALTALLSDAYLAGGSLAAEFGSSDNGGGPIPGPLRRWARQRQVELPTRGGWNAETGERLYALATNLTSATPDLLAERGVSVGAACFAVASGLLSPLAMEAVLRWSAHPARVLRGGGRDRLSYLLDQHSLRAALMVGAVVRRIERAAGTSDDDDAPKRLEVQLDNGPPPGMDATTSGVRLTAPPGLETRLGWKALAGTETAERHVTVHVLAVEDDLIAAQLARLTPAVDRGSVVIVSADALGSREPGLDAALATAENAGLVVLAAPDYTTTLDAAADRFLQRARTVRT
jgi:hypothetical protein